MNLLGGKPSLVSFHFQLKVKTRRPYDDQDRRDRIELRMDHWSAQLPRLVTAYLEFRLRDSGDGLPPADGDKQGTASLPGSIEDIELVDIFCESLRPYQYGNAFTLL